MPGSLGQLGEEQLPHPFRLPPVFDDEGELGLSSAIGPDVNGVAYDLLAHHGEERRPLAIRTREGGECPLRYAWIGYMEPLVDDSLGEMREHRAKARLL